MHGCKWPIIWTRTRRYCNLTYMTHIDISVCRWKLEWAEQPPATLSVAELSSGVVLKVKLTNTGAMDASKALLFFVAVTLPAPAAFMPPRKSLFAISKHHLTADTANGVVSHSSSQRVDRHGSSMPLAR